MRPRGRADAGTAGRLAWLMVALTSCTKASVPTGAPNDETVDVVLVAGGPSHGPGEHEYRAGALLLAAMLRQNQVTSRVIEDGWPQDESAFDGARALVFLTDGNRGHPWQAESGQRLSTLEKLAAKGVGIATIHWAVHVVGDARDRVRAFMGGHYEDGVSTNPIWEARFETLPEHPITRGVAPFSLRDEWYYNLRFVPPDRPDVGLLPILRAVPPEETRRTADAAAHPGRAETVAWVFERSGGGRSFGFTGLHFHTSWGQEPVRRLVTNAVMWIAGVTVPASGARVDVDPAELQKNLDRK